MLHAGVENIQMGDVGDSVIWYLSDNELRYYDHQTKKIFKAEEPIIIPIAVISLFDDEQKRKQCAVLSSSGVCRLFRPSANGGNLQLTNFLFEPNATCVTCRGRDFIYGTADGFLTEFDITTGSEKARMGGNGVITTLKSFENLTIFGTDDGQVKIWDSREPLIRKFSSIPGPVLHLDITGNVALVAGKKELYSCSQKHSRLVFVTENPVKSIFVTDDAHSVVSTGKDILSFLDWNGDAQNYIQTMVRGCKKLIPMEHILICLGQIACRDEEIVNTPEEFIEVEWEEE